MTRAEAADILRGLNIKQPKEAEALRIAIEAIELVDRLRQWKNFNKLVETIGDYKKSKARK